MKHTGDSKILLLEKLVINEKSVHFQFYPITLFSSSIEAEMSQTMQYFIRSKQSLVLRHSIASDTVKKDKNHCTGNIPDSDKLKCRKRSVHNL